jgi:preprotein translocase subunit SecF
MKFPIIKHAKIWLTMGLLLVIISNIIFWKNAKPSVQFTGGVELKTDAMLSADEVKSALTPKLQAIGYATPAIAVSQQDKSSRILIQVNVDNQDQVQKLSTIVGDYIKSKNATILEQSVIGASVGEYVKSSAIKAITLGILFIALYMMFTFSAVREMVSPLILAVITVVTLLFDISIPA